METNKHSVCYSIWDHLFDLSHPFGTPILASISVATSVSPFLLGLQTSVSLVLDFIEPVLPVQSSFVRLCPFLVHCVHFCPSLQCGHKRCVILTCVSSPTEHSAAVCVALSCPAIWTSVNLMSPFFMLFCIFPSERATDSVKNSLQLIMMSVHKL